MLLNAIAGLLSGRQRTFVDQISLPILSDKSDSDSSDVASNVLDKDFSLLNIHKMIGSPDPVDKRLIQMQKIKMKPTLDLRVTDRVLPQNVEL